MTGERPAAEALQHAESIPYTATDPEAYAEAIFSFPGSLEASLVHPERHYWPSGKYEAVVAAQQLRALGSSQEARILQGTRGAVANTLNGPRWESLRKRVSSGHAGSVDLQLMLFAATGDALHFNHRNKMVQFAQQHDLPGSVLFDLLSPAIRTEQDRRSLRDYVVKKYDNLFTEMAPAGAPKKSYQANVRFTENSPHVPLIAQLDWMRMVGYTDLDVARDDPIRDALIDRVGNLLNAVRGSGEYQMLPAHLWWEAHALKTFAEDRAAFVRGETRIVDMESRQWKFLGTSDGVTEFTQYLSAREKMAVKSDALYKEWFAQPVEALRRAFMQVAESGNAETLGILWGILLERRLMDFGGRPATTVLKEVVPMAKTVLEPYVLDGMELIADRTAPRWLRVATFDSYLNNTNYTSVFTDAFGSRESDRAAAGAALAQSAAVEQRVTAYGAFRSETALTVAYQMRRDCARDDLLGKEIATRRMMNLLQYYDKFRKPEDRRLAPSVRRAYEQIRRDTRRFALS